MVRGSNPGGGEIFRPGVHPASYTMGTGSFSGVKGPRRGVDHPPPSSAEVKERVELYLCSPFGPSWPVLEWTLHCFAFYCLHYRIMLPANCTPTCNASTTDVFVVQKSACFVCRIIGKLGFTENVSQDQCCHILKHKPSQLFAWRRHITWRAQIRILPHPESRPAPSTCNHPENGGTKLHAVTDFRASHSPCRTLRALSLLAAFRLSYDKCGNTLQNQQRRETLPTDSPFSLFWCHVIADGGQRYGGMV